MNTAIIIPAFNEDNFKIHYQNTRISCLLLFLSWNMVFFKTRSNSSEYFDEEFLDENKNTWKIKERFINNNGFTILERIK